MKNISYFIICFVSLLSAACSKDLVNQEPDGQPETYTGTEDSLKKTWEYIDDYIESDVGISDVRPFTNVLSEKEALVRVYSALWKQGYFSPDNSMFAQDPRLLTAKAARPMLIYDFAGNPADVSYRFYVVAEDGEAILEQYVGAIANVGDDKLLGSQSGLADNRADYLTFHYITEGELIELIGSQFDGALPDERPILVQLKLKNNNFSVYTIFWYFTVGGGEYIVSARVNKWRLIVPEGGLSNHAAISKPGGNGDGMIGGERMARLDTPAAFYEVLRQTRTSATDNWFPYNLPDGGFDWTAIPLK